MEFGRCSHRLTRTGTPFAGFLAAALKPFQEHNGFTSELPLRWLQVRLHLRACAGDLRLRAHFLQGIPIYCFSELAARTMAIIRRMLIDVAVRVYTSQ
jgi:hypothetical protein